MVLALGNLFNREGVERVLQNVADELESRGDRPWALLVDVREWQGGDARCVRILAGVDQRLDRPETARCVCCLVCRERAAIHGQQRAGRTQRTLAVFFCAR